MIIDTKKLRTSIKQFYEVRVNEIDGNPNITDITAINRLNRLENEELKDIAIVDKIEQLEICFPRTK